MSNLRKSGGSFTRSTSRVWPTPKSSKAISGKQSFNLLAVWAFYHGLKVPSYRNGVGTRAAIRYYREFISEVPSIVAGDFNNHVVWDKPGKIGNFSCIVEDLCTAELLSAYHRYYNCNCGEEPEPTLLWRKNKAQTYHIDYCFIHKHWVNHKMSVSVGNPEDWKILSDHVPLVVEFEPCQSQVTN